MADNTNDLEISLGLDPSDYRRGLAEAERLTQQGASRIESAISGIADVGKQLAGLGTVLSTSITLPIIALGKEALIAYGNLQALELGIEAVAGSASYAGRQMEELREIAKLPGLGLKEAAKGSVGLQAIGYSAGNAEKILLQFGNAIATVGKGRVEFERAIYGVQQLANTDFPLGEDLNIIKDALPQVSTLLKAAFGTSRTEDLQKMKVSSKAVMDVILSGLEKLPRVSGGIKNAFENLADSMQQNLARVGKILDDNFNISGIIDSLVEGLDKAISKFESLSKPVQEIVLIFIGLAAATGPVLLGLGGILALLPTLVNGFNVVRTAILAFNTALLTNPYLAAGAALLSLVAAFGVYRASVETATERQDRWNDSLAEASSKARVEISSLDTLYKKTQDHKIAIEERNEAIDQMQKEYPFYFGNLTNEAILAGKAAGKYAELRTAILRASLARAAQKELDKRAEDSLEKEVTARKKLTALFQIQKINNSEAIRQYIKDYENAMTTTEKLSGGIANPFANSLFMSDDEIKAAAKNAAKVLLKSFSSDLKEISKESKPLLDVLNRGAEDIKNLDVVAPDTFLPGIDKVKKETQKQLAEIYPIGSIAELRQRAELLVKAIETTNNDIVKVRGLDKYGKDKTKAGLPIFTGEILSLENAYERLNELKILIGEVEITPAKITGRGLLDEFGNEFKSLNDLMSAEAQRTGQILGTDLPFEFTKGADKFKEAVDNAKLEKKFKDLNKSLSQILTSSVVDSISDAFAAIGTAIANGTNVISAVGKSLLSSFGSLLTTFGKQLIEYGIGLIVVKQAIKNPYLAIAAGAALVALGSAFSASVNKTVNDSGIGGGSVSSSAGTGSSGGFSNTSYSQGGISGGEVVFRISGPDLIGTINRNVSSESRLNAG